MHKALGLVAILLVGLVGGCGDKTPPQAPATSGGSDAGAKPKPSSATGNSANTSSKPTKSSSTAQRPAAEQQAINDVRKLNGKIQYADSAPDSPVIKVSFKGLRDIGGADLGCLKALPTIVELNLEIARNGPQDISLLTSLPKLKVLYLPNLPADQFATLAQLPALESLSVGIDKPSSSSSGQDFLRQALDGLSGSRTLKHLRITQGGSGIIGANKPKADSFASLPKITTLAFIDISPLQITDEAMADIGRCGNLETLILTNMNGKLISDKGIQSLSACNKLKVLSVKGVNDSILTAAAQLGSLVHFDSGTTVRVSDSLLVGLKRDNPRLTVTVRAPFTKWWDEIVATK